MKKAFVLLAICVLLAFALTACDISGGPEGTPTPGGPNPPAAAGTTAAPGTPRAYPGPASAATAIAVPSPTTAPYP